MHPAIRIISLIIVTIFITQGSWLSILLVCLLLLPFYFKQPEYLFSAVKMAVRLKWFFLSILLLYFYYTPELPQEQNSLAQIEQRFIPGLMRISILLTILFAVNLFIKTTSKEQILAALLWLFSPLKLFHIEIDRMALRAILTIEYIEYIAERLKHYQTQSRQKNHQSDNIKDSGYIEKKRQSIVQLVRHSAIILTEIIAEAENTASKSYSITLLQSPLKKQFVFPLLLCISLYFTL